MLEYSVIVSKFLVSLLLYLVKNIYRIEKVAINGIIPILIFILKTYVILNERTNAIKSIITRLKYNPLLSNILYKQNIIRRVNTININAINSSI